MWWVAVREYLVRWEFLAGPEKLRITPAIKASGVSDAACNMTATWLPNESCRHAACEIPIVRVVLTACAHGAGLDEIRATQQKLIAARDSGKPLRDEVPLEAVALAKRQLLSWLESRLPTFGQYSEIENLTSVLNGELHAALTPTQDDQDHLGEMDVSSRTPKGNPAGSR